MKIEQTEIYEEKTVLVGLITPNQNEEKSKEYLGELAFLAETAGATPEKVFFQRLDYPNPRTYVGPGKLLEIKDFIIEHEISLVIFDDELSPSQLRNIERELNVKILDRTNLILDIFAKRLLCFEPAVPRCVVLLFRAKGLIRCHCRSF